MKRIYLILLILFPLFAVGQDNNESIVNYKLIAAKIQGQNSDEVQDFDLTKFLQYHINDYVLEFRSQDGKEFYIQLKEDLNPKFDDSGEQEDGSLINYYLAVDMKGGDEYFVKTHDYTEETIWTIIAWHEETNLDNSTRVVIHAKKIN